MFPCYQGYAVGSLLGHVHMAMDEPLQAKKYYDRVLQSFNRPDHVHMLHVNLALIHDKTFDDDQTSRKLMLHCCKHSPTPYTWLSAGLLFMKQNDLLSAEECLTQSNVCDNRFPETWAYLALANVELERYVEAENCYEQAIKVCITVVILYFGSLAYFLILIQWLISSGDCS